MNGKIDAYMAFMAQAHGLHERKIGHVLVDLARTEPWSKTFCCLTVGRTAFVQDNPIATKRALRALLKATDMCASEPQKAAQRLVDGGFVREYDNAFNLITDRATTPGARSTPSTRCGSTPSSFASSAS